MEKKITEFFNIFFFFLTNEDIQTFFKYLTIFSDICSLPVLHLPGFTKKNSMEVAQRCL